MEVLIEKYNLQTSKVKKTIKITLLTDLHYMDKTPKSFNESLVNAVKKIAPNYICLAGDYFCGYGQFNFNTVSCKKNIQKLLRELSKIAPVILSLGNHDLSISEEAELRDAFKTLKEDNIYPLDNESIEFENIFFSSFYPRRKSYAISKITVKKANMIIEDWNKSGLNAKEEKFSILLHHLPNTILDSEIQNNAQSLYNYDLILCGHAHNGWLSPSQDKKREEKINKKISKLSKKNKNKFKQLEAKKYYGFCESIINFPPFLRKVSRGMHEVNKTKIIISKGVTTGGKLVVGPKLLLNTNKEYSYITEIEINPKNKY